MKLQDIAKKLGVSAATVSRALNPATSHLISDKVRARIERFAEKVNFVPSRAGRELSTGRTHAIGVLIPTTFDSFFFNDLMIKILAGVDKALAENPNYTCKLIIIPKGESISEFDKKVIATGIDGLLLSSLCDHGLTSSHFLPDRLLGKWNHPVMVLGMQVHKKWGFSCLYSSNKDAARRAVTHLIRKGHRRIVCISPQPAVPDSIERLEGYKLALKDHQIPFDPNLVVKTDWRHEVAGGLPPTGKGELGHNMFPLERAYQVALNIFQSKDRPSAIFSANDETAIGVLRALRVLGINCPKDVAVMGFDGIAPCELVDPPLSTVSQPTFQMAEKGTRILIDLIEKRINGPVKEHIPMPLIIRDSA